MAAIAAQFSSLDHAVESGLGESSLESRTLPRRTVSIFSRRGTDIPKSVSPLALQAALPTSVRGPVRVDASNPVQKSWLSMPSRPMTERQKSWLSRKSSTRGSSTTAMSPGTILNAVPPAKTTHTLTSVGGQSPSSWENDSTNLRPPTLSNSSDKNFTGISKSTTLVRRAPKPAPEAPGTRIGVWVDGVAHWDAVPESSGTAGEKASVAQQTSRDHSVPRKSSSTRTQSRPTLSVFIPRRKQTLDHAEAAPKSASRSPAVTLQPSALNSCLEAETPVSPEPERRAGTTLASAVSPIDRDVMSYRGMGVSDADPTCFERLRPIAEHRLSSSSSSVVAYGDTASEYSTRSSATSIDESHQHAVHETLATEPKTLLLPGVKQTLSTTLPGPPGRDPPPIPPLKPRQRNYVGSVTASLPSTVRTDADPPSGSDSGSDSLENGNVRLGTHRQSFVPPLSCGDPAELLPFRGSGRSSDGLFERAPTLPRRSRKREWRLQNKKIRSEFVTEHALLRRRKSASDVHIGQAPSLVAVHRSRSVIQPLMKPHELRTLLADGSQHAIGTSVSITESQERQREGVISRLLCADEIVLHLLSSSDTMDDLYNTSTANKSIYRVYQRHESMLVRSVLARQSPAALELRDWSRTDCSEDAPCSPVTETQYAIRDHGRDAAVLRELMHVMTRTCHLSMRPETLAALSRPHNANTQRYEDALWRIWSFCKIFGAGKGREEDVVGQVDWLRGGPLANNDDLTATMNMNWDYEAASVLLNPPEHFAKGNPGGLDAQQLYDMLELWDCLERLLDCYSGQMHSPSPTALFDHYEENEQHTADRWPHEWTAFLLTLGPAVVLEISKYAADPVAGFKAAKVNGWTHWNPPSVGNTRTTFLKEPVARLYEERIAGAAAEASVGGRFEQKEASRKQVAHLASEIKLARRASSIRRRPSHPTEKFTASWTQFDGAVKGCPPRTSSIGAVAATYNSYPTRPRDASVNFSRRHAPPLNSFITRRISSISEERIDGVSLRPFAGIAENTSERAIKTITDIGFSVHEAREALRMTDPGDGLRVDRAVDLLLRRRS